ncbi:hypothetical protein [Nocardia sp. NPDC004123]
MVEHLPQLPGRTDQSSHTFRLDARSVGLPNFTAHRGAEFLAVGSRRIGPAAAFAANDDIHQGDRFFDQPNV